MNNFGSILLNSFLPNLATNLPLIIILLVGFVMALVRWRKNPRASLLIVIATDLALIVSVLSIATSSFLFYLGYEVFYLDFGTVNIIFQVTTVILNLMMAVSWVLMFIAVFGKRKSKQNL